MARKDKKKPENIDQIERKVISSKISLLVWFRSKVAERQLKDYQLLEISTFIKKQGLSQLEDRNRFDICLNRFLGK
jgi:hypothetical protein